MDTIGVVDLLKLCVKPSTSQGKYETLRSEALLESAKATQREEARRLIQEAEGLPVLSSYSNDGTPV
eukprot:353585-Lingulodinium_polyedra.AAC.1